MVAVANGVIMKLRGDDVDMTIFQGKTVSFALVWGGDDPVDVTGWSAEMVLRTSRSASTAVLEASSPNEITVGTTDGRFDVEIPASVTADLDLVSGVYEIRLIDPTGPEDKVYLGQSGNFTIVEEV